MSGPGRSVCAKYSCSSNRSAQTSSATDKSPPENPRSTIDLKISRLDCAKTVLQSPSQSSGLAYHDMEGSRRARFAQPTETTGVARADALRHALRPPHSQIGAFQARDHRVRPQDRKILEALSFHHGRGGARHDVAGWIA